MRIFGKLFGRGGTKPRNLGRKIEMTSFGSTMMDLPELNHFGPYSLSPNGRYTLIWQDGTKKVGGSRDRGEGRYVLLDDGKLAVDGRMERPNDGKVANDGTFVLNDWRFSNGLSGIFWAFRVNGSRILSRSFSANLLNNGLSSDGAFACCQTANATNADGGVLAVFDLLSGNEICVFVPESGWASGYRFHTETRRIQLLYTHEGGAFAYSLDGTFLERDKWVNSRIDRGDIYLIKRLIEESSHKRDIPTASRLLAGLEVGLRHQNTRDISSLSLAWRLKGELYEVLKSPQDALSAYVHAFELNPKIGVKRHIERLRKTLSQNQG